MTTLTLEKNTRPVVPTPEDIKLAKETTRQFAALSTKAREDAHYALTDKKSKVELKISKSMFNAFIALMKEMADGKAIMLIPVDAELSTQEAADMLNVSRPYVVKLLDEKQIPFRTVGRYRRVRFEDLLKYQRTAEARRQAALNEMAAQAQELGLE